MNQTSLDLVAVLELIKQLGGRIDSLEKSNIDWFALIISIVSIIVSIIISNKNNQKTDQIRKETNLNTIKSNIDSANLNFQNISLQIETIANSAEIQKIKGEQINAAQELVLNAYEDGCDAFYKGKINKQDFIDKYDIDIGVYIENFPDKFTGPIIMYTQMMRYFNEYHRNKKVKE